MPRTTTRNVAAEGPQGHWADKLVRDGYCVIPAIIPRHEIAELDKDLAQDFAETPFCDGGFYGARTKRFGRLLLRSPTAHKLVMNERILAIVEKMLAPWCDTIQLNLTQGLALHPGARPQLPHRDQDMWRGDVGRIEYLVNVMWPFTRYTSANGATLMWPGSHGAAALEPEPRHQPVAMEIEPGSALIFLGSTLHGAGGNRSDEVRRGAIISYCLGWLKPYENPWLAYPPEVARRFDPDLAALAGYVQHRPNLGNFEGQCPSILLRDDVPARPGAVDALRPDQQALLADFLDAQDWPPTRGRA